jgi:DNA-binding IclR family transcriptional regulator
MKPATTISKVCRVLAEFRHHPCMGLTDLARRTDLLPSDVHRILASLKSYGFIEQNSKTRTYHLGIGLMKLGLVVSQRSELRQAARPVLQRLSELMGTTAHMAIFDRSELDIFIAEQIDSSAEIQFSSKLGVPTSPHSTALGKAIMANIDRETALRILQKTGLPRFTSHTITRLRQFEAELTKTRVQGYGVDREESADGACCIGAPIRDRSGETVGAISVSMSAVRFYQSHEPRLAAAVKSVAADLSAALGYEPEEASGTRTDKVALSHRH